MGLLSRIFNTKTNEIGIAAENKETNVIRHYKEKYEKMQKEGKKIDWREYEKSIDAGWPYPVATERERESIESIDKQVLRKHAINISSILRIYKSGCMEEENDTGLTAWRDEEKVNYWKNVLIEGAANGDRTFQAALASSFDRVDGLIGGWLTEAEKQQFIDLYEQDLIADAEAGDADAMYAVAEFCMGKADGVNEYRKMMAEEAMNKGSGDAAYLCAELYKVDCLVKGTQWEYNEVINYYKKGADCDNGAMLGIMQELVAEAYSVDDEGLPRDIDKSVYYYNLAISNGNKQALDGLKFMKEHPELYR